MSIEVMWRTLGGGLSKLGKIVLGPAEQFVMRHRILNGTLLAGVFAMGLGLVSEFFREGFETGGLVGLWLAFASSIVFYYLARIKRIFRWLVVPTFAIGAISTMLQIQYSGGIVSANIMVLFPLLIMYMLILGQRFDWLAILGFVAALIAIRFVQEIHPDWFSDYSSVTARNEDFLVTGVTVLIVVGLMLRTLNRSYEDAIGEVRRLKDQQDGDYFLTSLLIRPLAGIRVRSRTVQLASYIKQKKSFRFKERAHELGGDICVADQIVLRGRSYVVFANGDAMGKSMQGAGGVLVFGTAFRALVERTHREGLLSEYFPERWLRAALDDLNNVFEGFDGSMSMSLVLGLVDEETGFLYYINAEHPFPIRLRNGKAEFLSEEATNFKLGMLREKARIETCWVQQSDLVITGSDGRDDLAMGMDASDGRVINEDHTAILEQVERSQGDLESLSRLLQDTGELTDDLSLLSIQYRPDTSQTNQTAPDLSEALAAIERGKPSQALPLLHRASELAPGDARIWKLLYEANVAMKQHSEAAQAAAHFVSARPSNLQMIYNSAVQYTKAGMYNNAIEMAERLHSRRPDAMPVLKLLVQLYKKTDRIQLAEELEGMLTSDSSASVPIG